MNAAEVLEEIFEENVRPGKYASRVNLEMLGKNEVVDLANAIVEHNMEVEVKRSGTGIVVIATNPVESEEE